MKLPFDTNQRAASDWPEAYSSRKRAEFTDGKTARQCLALGIAWSNFVYGARSRHFVGDDGA